MERTMQRDQNRTRIGRPALALAAAALALAGCITEVDPGPTVVLPPEAVRFERFIDARGEFSADRVTIQAVTAYRREIAAITTEGYHTKRETPDRIELVNNQPDFKADPLRLAFRNLSVKARESIVVVFSDVPLLKQDPNPTLVLLEGEGLAHLKSSGVDLLADKVVVVNDDAKGFHADGRPWTGGATGTRDAAGRAVTK